MKITIDLTQQQVEQIVLQAISERSQRVSGKSGTPKTPKNDGPSDTEIRQWAHENDVDVNEKGRVKKEVKLQFLAAHD